MVTAWSLAPKVREAAVAELLLIVVVLVAGPAEAVRPLMVSFFAVQIKGGGGPGRRVDHHVSSLLIKKKLRT
jgi:hypothetical protein